nr:MAG: hypothetical protein [Bacteriophage sp.]
MTHYVNTEKGTGDHVITLRSKEVFRLPAAIAPAIAEATRKALDVAWYAGQKEGREHLQHDLRRALGLPQEKES